MNHKYIDIGSNLFMKLFLLLASLFLFQPLAFAQTVDANPKTEEVVSQAAQVPMVDLLLHGMVLDKELFEYHLRSAAQNGQEDSLDLRLAIRDELYSRALLMEQAKSIGLTKDKGIKLLTQETQENVYIDLLLQEYLKNHPITDAMLKTEYDRQVKELSPNGVIVEYHLANIVVSDEKLAKELVQKAKTISFAQLAKENSMDPSASRGGDLGWVNIVQLTPAVKAALPTNNHQQVIKTPIQIGKNWHIIKFFERREGKPGNFADTKERLKPAVAQRLRQEYIEELRQKRIQARNEK